MYWYKRVFAIILVVSLVAGMSVLSVSVNASENPMAITEYDAFGAPVETQSEETEPEAAQPEELSTDSGIAEESTPEETVSEETVPEEITDGEAETAPEETESAQTEPETNEPEEPWYASTLEGMPLYDQNDYPNVRYGTGSVADNGCSAASLAMVATYMTGYTYYPDEMARYFGGMAENNIDRLEIGSELLGLSYRKAENWHRAREAIREGKIAIVLMGVGSYFTENQHFIVVTGMTEDGRFLVNDPNSLNYDRWELKPGFQEGFAERMLIQGYSGAWIYDKNDVPKDVPYYYESDIDRSNDNYPELELTQADINLIASVVWAEARGECEDGQQAVAEVILNRLASADRFPNNLNDVIYGEGQFRSVDVLKDAEPSQAQYEAIERARYGTSILPRDVYYFATYPVSEYIWGVIGGHIFCY